MKTSLTCIALLAIGLVGYANGCSQSDGTSCSVATDCRGSSEATAAGRCAPELACVNGACHAECLGTCDYLGPNAEAPCPARAICTQSLSGNVVAPVCTKRPIHCAFTSDCPAQKPGDAGEWTCDAEVCHFPGFAYVYE